MSTPLTLSLRPDQARGVVQLALCDLRARGLAAGDAVRLAASAGAVPRATHGRVTPGDLSPGQIATDAATAANCNAMPGDPLTVEPASLGPLALVHLRVDGAASTAPSDLKDALFDMALTEGDRIVLPLPGAPQAQLTVLQADPDGAGLVTEGTAVTLETAAPSGSSYDGIGGLRAQIARVHDLIGVPLTRRDLFDRLGVTAPRGVLFTGPPGTGKTLLARQVAAQTKAAFFQIDGPEILSKHYGDSEAALRRVFDAAAKAQPAILFIDEIDAIAPRRAALSGEKQVERRVVAQLLTLMDGLQDRGRVVVMAATNLPDAVDPALRRPGRFDREVSFTPPSALERAEILAVHLSTAPLACDVDLVRVAEAATGYVGADLAALAREAALAALARAVREAGGEAAVQADRLFLTQADFDQALAETRPSALRAHAAPPDHLDWARIGGLDKVKNDLLRWVHWPQSQAKAFAALGLRAPRGILFSGPPGSGKTLLARALAGESGRNFIPIRPPDLISQFLGEAERAVMALFDTARQTAPSLVFIDEIDALAPRRGGTDGVFDRIVAQLLVEIDGIASGSGVTVVAATNRADAVDPALLRPGRFDQVLEIGLPDLEARTAILSVHLANRPQAADIDLVTLAQRSDGASGADLASLVEGAAWRALRRCVEHPDIPLNIAQADLEAAWAEAQTRLSTLGTDFIRPKGTSP